MRYATFIHGGTEKIGLVSPDGSAVSPLDGLLPGYAMSSLIEDSSKGVLERIRENLGGLWWIPLTEVTLQAPLPHPPRGVICMGKNYPDHIREVAKEIDSVDSRPEHPIFFSKLVDRCPGPDGRVPSHKELTDSLDYEVELGVIIGREGRDIPLEKASEYIFGYTIINDISVRDAQRIHVQWLRGKSFDGTCPMGPWIVGADELALPFGLDIRSMVNGELRQQSNTREMIFDIPSIISGFSRGITLKPGDVIATGTPSGVGMGFHPPRYLKPGDVVECRIEGIGILRNSIV